MAPAVPCTNLDTCLGDPLLTQLHGQLAMLATTTQLSIPDPAVDTRSIPAKSPYIRALQVLYCLTVITIITTPEYRLLHNYGSYSEVQTDFDWTAKNFHFVFLVKDRIAASYNDNLCQIARISGTWNIS